MSSESEQQDWDDFVADYHGQWMWQCSCGKESVFSHPKKRAQKRAHGHQINCNHQGTTEIAPADNDDD